MASKSKKGGAAARPSLGARGFDVAKYEGDPAKLTVAQLRAVLGYAGIQLPMNTVKKAALVRQFEELQTKLRMSQTGQELGEDDEPNDIEEVELSQCTPLIVSKRCSVRSDKKLRRLNFEGNAPELPKNTDPMRTGDSSDPVTITTQHPPLATPRRAVPSTPSHQIKDMPLTSVAERVTNFNPPSPSNTQAQPPEASAQFFSLQRDQLPTIADTIYIIGTQGSRN
ncbi:hypothetical protein Pelo_2350 [Pelomyxa schiedti]|nr:hypothetical protein Pelo_2350 [Pelomyxa schiedti]